MIAVRGLTKVFNRGQKTECVAVDQLCFECKGGEIFGLLGLNGAGKTTTLRMLSTILKPTNGSIRINNIDALQNAEKVRGAIGFLTGDTKLYGRLTTRETVRYFGRLYGLQNHKIDQRIGELSEMLDMNAFIDKRVGELSTGMKQKVSIARAIVHDPQIMILDEPTAGLDALTARVVTEFIKHSRSNGKCLIFSTHIMREAELLCDKIAVIDKGKILALGTLEELKQRTSENALEEVFFEVLKESQ